MWGGLECSVVRVGDGLRDQFHETLHAQRGVRDLEAVAALGLRVLRYPVSWERVSPDHPDEFDWHWHDSQLRAMRWLDIRPILGLVHHGGGPHRTSLEDPLFPEKLAAFAGRVAQRYPWVQDWTPVNEPLTTARFSALYGHWYPHRADEASFLRMVVNQCRAVLLSMRAIRQAVPGARLVQTEDLGCVLARPALQHQAEYENQRRWLSFDLLLGRVTPAEAWYGKLLAAGVPRAHLDAFLEADVGPVLLGLNHYVTSERFLDDRLHLYPAAMHGGNGYQAYVDTEAARVPLPAGSTGWLPRLREAVQRYPGLPAAVTEAHLGCCEPEHQLRWLDECWQAVLTLRREGHDLRAVTAWSLFGAVDWTSLLIERRGDYEPGVFDVRAGGAPRETMLGQAVRAYSRRGTFQHEALAEQGWWSRPDRFHPGLRLAG